MAKVYRDNAVSVYAEGMGWVSPKDARGNAKPHEASKHTILHREVPYLTENGERGTEDFSNDRWQEQAKGMIRYSVELKTFREGKGKKLVADSVVDLGRWYTSKLANLTAGVTAHYQSYINTGYKVVTKKW